MRVHMIEKRAQTPAELQFARAFQLDDLYDAMTSGRLCGMPVPEDVAQVLLILLERVGWRPDTAELAFAMAHFPAQFGVAEIRSTMVNIGFPSVVHNVVGARLQLCTACTLVCDETGEIWLLRKTQQNVELFRPGKVEDVRRVRVKEYYQTIQFETKQPGTQPARTVAKWASSLFCRFLPEYRALFALTVLSGLTIILVAFGVKVIFDTIIPSRNVQTLGAFILGFGMVAVAELVLRRVRAGIIARIVGRVDYIVGTSLFSKLLRLPGTMLSNAAENEQFARIKQFESLREVFGGPLLLLALELGVAAVLLVVITLIAWQLALLLVGLVAFFLLTALALRPGIVRAGAATSAAQAQFTTTSNEFLSRRKSIRRRGLYKTFSNKQRENLRALIRARRRLLAEMQLLDCVALISLPVCGAVIIGTGALLAMQGSLSLGQLIAATILTWRLVAPVQQAIQVLPKLPELGTLMDQANMFFRLAEAPKTKASDVTRPCHGEVAVSNLLVRFPGSVMPTLMGCDFKVAGGKFIAVTGASGSGKSTLLSALSGNQAPQSGGVFVDGINLSQLSEGYRNRHIAYVPQRPIFIFGTVAQNLRLRAPGASDVQIDRVLLELGLDTLVQSLPDGLNTRIDPTTMTDMLSPGVRTLLALAQALMIEPAILLLDEPAGGLRGDEEARLRQAMRSRHGRMTIFLVTHRPSLVQMSDAVIHLDGGKIRTHAPQDLERTSA